MAQILVPTSDQAVGDWTTTPLWSKVDDDSTVNPIGDGTHIFSEEVNTSNTTNADFVLSNGEEPDTGNHIIRVRWLHTQNAADVLGGTVELYQGIPGTGTLIATLSVADMGTTENEETYTLTSGEVSNITDYTNLYLRCFGTATGGGKKRALSIEFVELEIPDPPISQNAIFFGTGL